MEILGLGFATAIGFFILMAKINIRHFTRYSWQWDLLLTVVLTVMFSGTFSGMVTAVIAGIFLSIFLAIAKFFIGDEESPQNTEVER